MTAPAPGAGRRPMHHITIRVPWHDSGWTGSVCGRPLTNTRCFILPRSSAILDWFARHL